MDNQKEKTITIQIPAMTEIAKRRGPVSVSFAMVIVFFFFTFCNILCGEQKISSLTGVNLVMGKTIDTGSESMLSNDSSKKDVKPNILAIIPLACAVFGLILFLFRMKGQDWIGFSLSAMGIISLILLQVGILMQIKDEASSYMKDLIKVTFGAGYWGAVCMLLSASVFCVLRIRYQRKEMPMEGLITENTQEKEVVIVTDNAKDRTDDPIQ